MKDINPSEIIALRAALGDWYAGAKRTLPWRSEPAPYRVWLSEIMCQQTQVATVIPYFERFLDQFPTVTDLAEAPEDVVLGAWAGLGYYRRARMLHAAAKVVATEYGGVFPGTVSELLALPGVGRYTAGAIASIAFGQAAAAVDGNVSRVLSRVLAMEQEANGTKGLKALWAVAERLVDPESPGAHNQALMELGALVCTPRAPSCERCPFEGRCAAQGVGAPEAYPKKKKKRPPMIVREVCGLALNERGDVLMARRPEGLLGGLWELPGGDLTDGTPRGAALATSWRDRLALDITTGAELGSVDHRFTHRHLTLDILEVRDWSGVAASQHYIGWAWTPVAEIGALPLSTLARKVFAAIGLDISADDEGQTA